MPIYAGLDLGGTKCAAILARDTDGEIDFLARKEIATAGKTWQEITDPLLAFLQDQSERPEAIGISCGGPLDGKQGIILTPPNLPSFWNVNICSYVSDKLGIPAALQNDADACGLAEWKYGAGRGTQCMVFLTFGTGLGAGLILGGKLYTGSRNLAGEVGHIRLKPDGPEGYRKCGSFEGFCSGGGIAQYIEMRTGKPGTAKTLYAQAEAKDPSALQLWKEIGEHFGEGLAVLVDILNPERIVAGSIFTRAYKYLYKPAMEGLRREALPESLEGFALVPAALGERIGDYAAVSIAAAMTH
ncbi:MAG: ROK family protein [Oscillospiraceae bacterium]|jgi:glucokinase|nr:ROK family protein [Oscillospiraceae bacterium]